jgi:ectoine hydroxylase-related dioxygenase (phytanoyl-CoA dioxygenase family)
MGEGFKFTSLDGVEDRFADVGYVRVRGVISVEEVGKLRAAIELIMQKADELPEGLAWLSPSSRGGYIVQRISRINQYSRAVDDTGRSHPRLIALASRLIGGNACAADGHEGSDGSVLVIKHPDNASEHRELRWHRDSKFTQHLPINPFINLGVYLDDCPTGSGQLVVMPRSHRLENFDPTLEETTLYHPGEHGIPARAGDVVVHSSELWHCSRAHMRPGYQRRVLYFNYYVAF